MKTPPKKKSRTNKTPSKKKKKSSFSMTVDQISKARSFLKSRAYRPKSTLLVALFLMVASVSTYFTVFGKFSTPQIKEDNKNYVDFFSKPRNVKVPKAWKYFVPHWELHPVVLPSTVGGNQVQSAALSSLTLVDDYDNRLEKEFKVPSRLRQRVQFWIEIYSRFDDKAKILHDKYNPGIIYGYLDFTQVYSKTRNRASALRKIKRYEKVIKVELRMRILEAMGALETQRLSIAESLKIQAFLAGHGIYTKEDALKLTETMRTQTGQRNHFLKAIERSRPLLPHIESEFKRKKMPIGLARIPFVESSFNPWAHSKDGARGIWQFMPATAKELIADAYPIGWWEPIRQTRGAVELLRRYRKVLPNWGATIVAYNSGVGRVRRLLKKNKTKNIGDLILDDNEKGLGFAGKNFLPEFLAANIVEAYKEELFRPWLIPMEFARLFKGKSPFPNEMCSRYTKPSAPKKERITAAKN